MLALNEPEPSFSNLSSFILVVEIVVDEFWGFFGLLEPDEVLLVGEVPLHTQCILHEQKSSSPQGVPDSVREPAVYVVPSVYSKADGRVSEDRWELTEDFCPFFGSVATVDFGLS